MWHLSSHQHQKSSTRGVSVRFVLRWTVWGQNSKPQPMSEIEKGIFQWSLQPKKTQKNHRQQPTQDISTLLRVDMSRASAHLLFLGTQDQSTHQNKLLERWKVYTTRSEITWWWQHQFPSCRHHVCAWDLDYGLLPCGDDTVDIFQVIPSHGPTNMQVLRGKQAEHRRKNCWFLVYHSWNCTWPFVPQVGQLGMIPQKTLNLHHTIILNWPFLRKKAPTVVHNSFNKLTWYQCSWWETLQEKKRK